MGSFDEAAAGLFGVAYRVAFRMTGSRLDAEDVAQEITARALVRWARVEPYAEAWACPWAARCAANLALDLLRRRRRVAPLAPGTVSSVDSDRLALVAALRGLPGRQREVVVLRYLADLTEAQVADRLGCSVGAVKQHARRGLEALRAGGELTTTEGR